MISKGIEVNEYICLILEAKFGGFLANWLKNLILKMLPKYCTKQLPAECPYLQKKPIAEEFMFCSESSI